MESTNVHGGEPGARTDDAADPGRKAGWFFALFVATIVSTSVLLYVGVATHANHPPASLLEAIEQIAIVVMLCLTWFVGLDAARATPSEVFGARPAVAQMVAALHDVVGQAVLAALPSDGCSGAAFCVCHAQELQPGGFRHGAGSNLRCCGTLQQHR